MEQGTQVAFEKMVFRKTNTQIGRHISVTPNNSTHKHLAYGRIIVNASAPTVSFSNGGRETGLVCLSGSAEVEVDSKSHRLGQYDAIYIPRDSQIDVTTESQADIAEFSAEVDHCYPLQMVFYETISKDPKLHFKPGGPANTRDLSTLIGNRLAVSWWLYFLRAGKLDELAASRARQNFGRDVCLLRHAGAGVRNSTRVQRH